MKRTEMPTSIPEFSKFRSVALRAVYLRLVMMVELVIFR